VVSGDLPSSGERIDCAGWQFEITALEGRRIDKVRAHRSAPVQ
jgi:putative hemolysin